MCQCGTGDRLEVFERPLMKAAVEERERGGPLGRQQPWIVRRGGLAP
jgi:hypothetical protein